MMSTSSSVYSISISMVWPKVTGSSLFELLLEKIRFCGINLGSPCVITKIGTL